MLQGLLIQIKALVRFIYENRDETKFNTTTYVKEEKKNGIFHLKNIMFIFCPANHK